MLFRKSQFIHSFDEFYKCVLRKSQMYLLIHYWDEGADMVNTWYYDSTCLDKAAFTNVFEKFNSIAKNLGKTKFLQVMSDDPNVNRLFLNLLAETRKEKQHSRLRHLGIPMYKIFDKSPVRRADYEKIMTAIERDYVLQFCSQRWIENARVAEKAENVWEKYLQIIDFWKTLPKSKQPGQGKPGTNKIYDTLLKIASDLLLLVKLELFKEVVDHLNFFIVTFQTHAPMVPLLVVKLEEIVRFYYSKVILPVTMKKANSTLKLIKFEFFL